MLRERLTDEFSDLLHAYLESDAEKDLYRASELGRQLVAQGVGPDTLVAMHHATVRRMMVDQSLALLPALVDKAFSFLLEVMMAYSLAYREHQHAEQQRFEQVRLYNEQLERHERELSAIIDSALDGLILLDRYERVRLINPPGARLICRSIEDIIGRPFPVERLPFEGRRVKAAVREIRVGGRSAIEWDVEAGRHAWHVTVVPVDQDGQFFGTLIVLRDTTRELEIERMKDDLLGLTVHEIRAPLGLVVAFAELLRTRDLAPATVKGYAATISQTAKHLNSLVKDFLLIHRLESGAIACNRMPVDLALLCQAVVERFAPITDRHHLVLDVPSDLPRTLADSDRLTDVLTNLLSNAIKYSPDGGEIRVEVRAVGTEIVVAVTDQGLGLAQEDIAFLFTKFYRILSPDRQDIEGTGLGLAICRQIIEAHEGRIWAESAGPGRGSRFAFSLPAAPPDASTSA